MAKTQALKQIFQLVLVKFKTKDMDYSVYTEFIYQVAVYIFGKGTEHDLSRFPSAISYRRIFKYLGKFRQDEYFLE